MDVFQGEQFYRYIYGDNIDYDACSQIVLALYRKGSSDVVQFFVKVEDNANYPGAELIQKSDNQNFKLQILFKTSMTAKYVEGTYMLEAKRIINGINMPVIKGIEEIFTIKKSLTK